MRNQTLLFAVLLAACSAVSAGESALDSLGTKAAKGALKSAAPPEVSQGLETIDKVNSAKKAINNPAGAAQDAAKKKALGAVPLGAETDDKATESASDKTKASKDATDTPSSLTDQAVKSAKGKAKKSAMDGALDMMH